MESFAKVLRQLEYCLCAHELLGKKRTLAKVFEALQHYQIIAIKIEAVSLDSTIVKIHHDGTGALKKQAPSPLGNPEATGQQRFIWLPRLLNAR